MTVQLYIVLQKDPFPGDAPIPADKIQKYRRGDKMVMVGYILHLIFYLILIIFILSNFNNIY